MSNTARNPITGDMIKSKSTSQQYRDNWDKIFNQPKETTKPVTEEKVKNG